MALSLAQEKALAIAPHVTGALSFISSCSILYDIIFSNRKQKLKRPYYRILLGLSIFDAMSSFTVGLATMPMPLGERWGAVGNTQTCTAQGFFNQLTLGSPFYNLMLAIYYLLLGRYHLKEEEIAERFEKYMHVTAIVTTVGTAFAGIPLDLYNDASLWCWIASYPTGSEGLYGQPTEIECERGHGAWLYRWVFFYGPLWSIIVATTVAMIMLTASIRREEKLCIEMMQMQDSSERSIHQTEQYTRNDTDVAPQPVTFNLERSRKMCYQAFFFLAAFYVTWWAPTINRMLQMIRGESPFYIALATAICTPLQGFFNFIVYRHGPCIA